jgi:hypothetical protein
MSKSVSVTCICGKVFERPIQRGRPAIWCLTCRDLPANLRPTRPVAVEGEAVESDRVVNEHDKYDGPQRDSIEANVAAVYAEWPIIWGASENDDEANTWLTNSLRAAYETVVPGYNKDRTEDPAS